MNANNVSSVSSRIATVSVSAVDSASDARDKYWSDFSPPRDSGMPDNANDSALVTLFVQ